jgi:hypothetical protein
MKSIFRSFLIAVAVMIGVCEYATAQSNDLGIVDKDAPAWNTSSWHQLPAGKSSLDVGVLDHGIPFP